MVETRHYDLQSVFAAAGEGGVFGKVPTQLMVLHRAVSQMTAPVILECGVNKGWSTGVIADACEERLSCAMASTSSTSTACIPRGM